MFANSSHEVSTVARSNVPFTQDGAKIKNFTFDLENMAPSKNYYTEFGKPDLLIHLAWQGLPNYDSPSHFEKYLMPQYHFLKNLIVNGLPKMVVTGTCLEYGMREGRLSEDMIADPQIPYALAKDTLRKFLININQDVKMDLLWLRLFYMYGEGQNPKSLLAQLQSSINSGEQNFRMSPGDQMRDYLPVEKVAAIIKAIALQDRVTGIINCCSGKPTRVKDLVEEYLKETHQHINLILGHYPYPSYEPKAFWGDDSRLNSILKTSGNTPN